jgi:hypothetical protein
MSKTGYVEIASRLVTVARSCFLFKTKKHDFFRKFNYANEIEVDGRISQNTRRAKFFRQRNLVPRVSLSKNQLSNEFYAP